MSDWQSIPGFEGYYEAHPDGTIRCVERRVPCRYGKTRLIKAKPVKGSPDQDGYLIVSLSNAEVKNKAHRAHRLVLLTFKGPCPPGKEARHLDGTPDHNAIGNLEWGTPIENWADRKAHGRTAAHSKGGKKKCT